VDGRPVLVDALGPFGNPTSDSARTMVTLATRNALVVVYAPAAYSPTRLTGVLDETASTLTRYCGGRVAEQRLLPASV
jgi:DNA/RNA-binding domain of Phe-tRNA-synthetase-like protein